MSQSSLSGASVAGKFTLPPPQSSSFSPSHGEEKAVLAVHPHLSWEYVKYQKKGTHAPRSSCNYWRVALSVRWRFGSYRGDIVDDDSSKGMFSNMQDNNSAPWEHLRQK